MMNGSAIVTLTVLPTATISGTATVCQNSSPQPLITFTGANGTAPYTFSYNINGGTTQTVATTASSSSVTVSVPTGTSGDFTYNLTGVSESSGTACSNSATGSATVTVRALPTATISGGATVCKDDAQPQVTFTGAGGTAPYTFTYNINGTGPFTATTTSGNSVAVPVPTGTAGTFVYTLVGVQESGTGTCAGPASGTATVVVNPYPDAAGSISGASNVCQGQTGVSYTVPAIPNATSYLWSYSGTGATITGTGNNITVSFASNATSGSLTVLGQNACGNGTVSIPFAVTVNPVPTATVSGTASVCRNAPSPSVTFTGAGGTAPYTFTYNINGAGTFTATTSSGNSVAVAVPTSTSGVFTYNLVGVSDSSPSSCSGPATGSAVVTVNELPTASIAGGTTVCQGAASPNVTFTGANGTAPYTFTYTINGSGPLTATTTSGNSVSVPVPTGTAGTFTYALVSVSDVNSCSNTVSGTTVFNINALPTATISGTATVCHNSSPQPLITFTGANGTAPYTFSYNINGGTTQTVATTASSSSVTVSVPTGTAGAFTYNLTGVSESSGTACSNSATGSATVTVRALPTATISGGATVCKDDAQPQVTFTGAGGTAPYTFTYNINGTGPFTATTTSGNSVAVPVPTGTAGTFVYTLVGVQESGTGTCAGPASGTATVVVNPYPDAAGSISGASNVCQGQTGVSYTVPAIPNATSYLWSYSGTGATITGTGNNITVSFASNATSGSLTVLGQNACGNGTVSIPFAVTVNPVPTATVSGTASVCRNAPSPSVTFTGAGGTAPYTFTYNINGAGTFTATTSSGNSVAVAVPTSTSGVFTYNLVGVSDSSPSSCSGPATGSAVVTVNELPTASIAGGTTVCQGAASPNVTFTGANGTAPYTFTYTINGSGPLTATTTSGNSVSVPVPTGTAGTFTYALVSVSDVNSCSNTVYGTTVFNINALPEAPGAISGKNSVCVGETGVGYSVGAINFATTYTWTYSGTGATITGTGNSITINFSPAATSGNLTVQGINSCGVGPVSANFAINVNPLPTATASSNSPVCVGSPLTLTGGVPGLSYSWSGPNSFSSSAQSPTVNASASTAMAGTYTLTVTDINGCQNTATTSVVINYVDVILSVSSPATLADTKVCAGQTLTYQQTASAGSGSYSYLVEQRMLPSGSWATEYTGPSNVFTTRNNLAAGNYELRFTAIDNSTTCATVTNTTFEVLALPTVSLSASNNSICVNDVYTLTATPSGYVNYTFNIAGTAYNNAGNNVFSISTLAAGNHSNIYVTVSNGACTASSSPTLSVTVNSLPTITLLSNKPTGIACENEVVTFTADGGVNYQFYVNGVASGALTANPVFTYSSTSNFTVRVEGYNAQNCVSSSSNVNITISKPVATIAASNNTICEGQSVTFTANGGVAYEFFVNGVSVQGPSATNTFTSTSLANGNRVSVVATDANNCISAASNEIIMTVNPNPTAVLVSDKLSVCQGLPVQFTASSNIGNEFAFYVNGLLAQSRSAVPTFTTTTLSNGDLVSAVVYVSTTGCSSTSNTITITVNPLPSVAISANPGLSIIQNTSVLFTATSIAGADYQWSVNGVVVKAFSADNTYTSSTLVNNDQVSVLVRDANGCENTASVTMIVYDTVQPLTVMVDYTDYCTTSATGVTFTIPNPQSGVVYELYREVGNVFIGAGALSGGVVSWTNIKNTAVGAERYYVIAYHPSLPAERVEMTNRPLVTEHALPIAYNLSPNTTVTDCNGGAGYEITLSNSQIGVSYVLYRNGSPLSTPIAGTGSSLSFGTYKTHGVYTINAYVDAVNTCQTSMSGQLTIDLSFLGIQYNLLSDRADGLFCDGDAGVLLYMEDTQAGVDYVLMLNGSTPVMTIAGTGNRVDFGQFTVEGNYTAEVQGGGCALSMNNTVTVSKVDLPTRFNVVSPNNGHYCQGSTGVDISISGQQLGVNYTLLRNGIPVVTLPGTISSSTTPLSFGLFNTTGTYSVVAVTVSGGCTQAMNNTMELVVDALPSEVLMSAPSSGFCAGDIFSIQVPNSKSGTDYYLLLNGVETGAVQSGNGGSISFANLSQDGTYGLKAIIYNTYTTCETVLAATLTMTRTNLPEMRDVVLVQAGTACDNGAILRVENSQLGINYQLWRTGSSTYSQMKTGTGSNLDFDPIVDKNGYYSVIAVADPGGCELKLTSSDFQVEIPGVVETFNVSIVSPSGTLCADATTGYVVGLSGSEAGVLYTLYNSAGDVETKNGDGNALTFAPVTLAGQYRVRAVNPVDPTCTVDMAGIANITYHALPTATLSSNQGQTILEGTQVIFTAGGGLSYEFYVNGVVAQALSINETYTTLTLIDGDVVSVMVSDLNGCTATASLTMTVLGQITPLTVTAIPDTYCQTSNGVTIVVSEPQANVTYELFRIEDNFSYGVGTVSGNEVRWLNVKNTSVGSQSYRVEGYYTSMPGVKAPMANTVVVTEYALPAKFDVSPTSVVTDCNGGAGYDITLAGSETNTVYTLYLNGTNTGVTIYGTGSAIVFPGVKTIGVHTVVASYTNVASCEETMNGAFTIDIPNSGNVHNLISDPLDGQFCDGSAGVAISLDNSDAGVTYMLVNDGITMSSLTGNGSQLVFGDFTDGGHYNAYADASGCLLPMNGSVEVERVDLPKIFTLIGENNGEYCDDDADGVIISLQGQQTGYIYELVRNGVIVATVTSTNLSETTPLVFGNYVDEGLYQVNAYVPDLGCSALMSGSVSVSKQPLPAAFAFIPENTVFCTGGSTTLYIPNSSNGTTYQLLKDGIAYGLPVPGTGSRIDFVVNSVGIYKILSTRMHTNVSCSYLMDDADAITVTESDVPEIRTVTSEDKGTDCDFGTVIKVEASQTDIEYYVYTSLGTPLNDYMVMGNGVDIEFPAIRDVNGTYYVVAQNAAGCRTVLSPDVVVNIPGAVKKQSVSIPSSICLGDLGVVITLDGSEAGVVYTLYNSSNVTIDTWTGNGGAHSFIKVYDEGEYYVVGANPSDPANCANEMLNRVSIKYNPLPTSFKMTGSGYYCGNSDAQIGLEQSEWGTMYTLMYQGADGLKFVGYYPGDFSGEAIQFTGIPNSIFGNGTYQVFATSENGCTSSMNGVVTVEGKTAPQPFSLLDNNLQYCSAEGGAEVYITKMQTGITYNIEKTLTGEIFEIVGNADSDDALLTMLEDGEYNITASWGGDACLEAAGNNPLTITTAVSPMIKAQLAIDFAVACQGAENYARIVNAENGVTYELLVDGVTYQSALTAVSDNDPAISWLFNGVAGSTQRLSVLSYIGTNNACAMSGNNEILVVTNVAPQSFAVTPDYGTYCEGEKGVVIGLTGSEANVFYELLDAATNERKDYYLPNSGEVGQPFVFRNPQLEGEYIVQARFISGGCISTMSNAAIIELDELSGNCIPIDAIDDYLALGNKQVSDTITLALNDIWNRNIDSYGETGNLKFTLVDKDNGFKWTVGDVTFTTIGEVILDEITGLLTYTKIPGFYGLDSVRYMIQNADLPDRYDIATLHIMVGNHNVEDGSLLIPNAFTPNGDTYNQTFVITGMVEDKMVDVTDPNVKSYLEVFNRWGTQVYKSKGDHYNNDWDGTSNGSMISIGKELPNGTYFYIYKIKFNLSSGKEVNKTYHGFVELRR